jgi:single-strand DNA-binding protein
MQSTVTLLGNLVDDVVVRQTSGGPVASFRMAVSNGYFDKRTMRYVERTTFLNVSAWRRLGENVAASVHRGQPVVVVGRLRQRDYERDGRQVTVVEVDADLVCHDLSKGSAVFARNPRGPQTADVSAGAGSMSTLPHMPEHRPPVGADPREWSLPGLHGDVSPPRPVDPAA